MKLHKSFTRALGMVRHSKLRSWLTIIGIVIGVASVIAIVSLGEGMTASVTEQFGDFGANILTVTPGYSQAMRITHGPPQMNNDEGSADDDTELDKKDVMTLKMIPDIEAISPQISDSVTVYYLGESASVKLTGVDPLVWSDVTLEEAKSGRLLSASDSNVVVIGSRLAEEYFDSPITINKMITIETNSFRVVGIVDGGSSIYMPLQSAYQILDDKENGVYDSIVVKVDEDKIVDDIIETMENKLMISRHVTEKTRDFSISDPSDMQEQILEMTGTMTMFLGSIAAISLVVGSVGIANTMFTSVLEKTKDIGIMKAIGAKNHDILIMFLFSSGIIGLIGGLIGVAVGVWASTIIGPILGSDIEAVVKPEVVFGALGISFAVGLLAGFAPAWQGSKLRPVDALRWE